MSINLLSNIWLKCGARFHPQAEIDKKNLEIPILFAWDLRKQENKI